MLGFALCALSANLELRAHIGMGAWNVFHQGVTNVLPITFGTASIVSSLVVLVISAHLGQRVGVGSILNMLVIGWLIDLFEAVGVVPDASSLAGSVAMIVASALLLAWGSYLYMSCALGCGPRDGLMSVLVARTGKPVGVIRGVLEGAVFVVGVLLGGDAGLGSVLSVVAVGPCIQAVYGLMSFDVTLVRHESLR